jgi:molybdopterin-dependent oxidoreductase alpha subunit
MASDRDGADSTNPLVPADLAGPPISGQAGIAGLVPFGLDATKPRHFREAAAVVWENRDNLKYAFDVLRLGVCDGCSLGPRGLEDDVIPGLHVCMSRLKLLRQNTVGAFDPEALGDIDRLRRMTNRQLRELGRVPYPFIRYRGDKGFRRASWDDALALLGDRLRAFDPKRTAWFATSKGITNETYYSFQKVARMVGSNHLDFCARLCHQATVAGLTRALGVGAPTCSLRDLIGTDLLLLWGTNLANNQPVSMKYLHKAKEQGTRIVVINPVLEKGLEAYWVPSNVKSALFGSRLMDDFIQVRPGGDQALMVAVMKLLIDWNAVDEGYIRANTHGWAELEASVRAASMDELLALSGVRFNEVEWLAKLIARARTMVTVYSMGITQHRFGTQNVLGIANLHLARGALGREKTGIMPIRGHSGVQGGSECGLSPDKLPGGAPLDAENLQKYEEAWGRRLPDWRGYTTGAMVEACERGEFDFLYNLGGNLFGTMPDPAFVARAFDRVAVRVHQDINVNTSTLLEPGEFTVLLPAETRYEQRGGGTSTNTERRIRFSPEIPGHPVVGECRPEWEIPALVAMAAWPELRPQLGWADAQGIRDEIGRLVPLYAGIETLRKAGDWVQWGGAQLFADARFPKLPHSRAKFHVLTVPDTRVPEGSYFLANRRGKQFNSMVFADVDTLMGGARDDVFISAADAARHGLRDGDPIRLRNEQGQFLGRARVEQIKEGHLQAYWPEINHLIPRCYDPLSEEPDYNTIVQIDRA